MEMLTDNPNSKELLEKLKYAIKSGMQELITLNANEAIKTIEKWYDDKYQEILILEELAPHP